MSSTRTLAARVATFILGASLMAPALAQDTGRTICAYDPAGKAGDYYRLLEEWSIEAGAWGNELSIRAYTDEETAAKDYEAGQCDAVVATGVRLQRFNRFPTTIEAIGGLPEYEDLGNLVNAFVKYPSAAKLLRKDSHETVGIIPVGKAYLIYEIGRIDPSPSSRVSVSQRSTTTSPPRSWSSASARSWSRPTSVVWGRKFNNGDVDACYAPAPVYQPFELYRGVGTEGGIKASARSSHATNPRSTRAFLG